MSVSILERPFLFDFANNQPAFKLSGTPTDVIGRKAVTRYKINTMPRINYNLLLTYGTKTFSFVCKTTTSAINSPFEIYLYSTTLQRKSELEAKIAKNYYISRDFEVNITDGLEITFTARQNGGNTVTLQSDDQTSNIQLISSTSGIERVEKTNYKVFAKMEVTQMIDGIVKTVQTPEILLHIDTDSKVFLPTTLLRSYFAGVDVPAVNEKFAVYPLKYALLKYRLIYSDYFDGLVQLLQYSDERYLVNGKISESCRAANIPDWSCPMGNSDSKLSSFVRPRSYGSPSGLIVKSYLELLQYACFMLFYNNESGSYTSSLEVRVDILNEDGSKINNINPGAIKLSNFSIVRIPLSISALSLGNHSTQILSYTVRIYHTATPTAVWTRTFIIQERPFYAKEFLLQNKYGFLESFFIDNEMIEKNVEGEKVTCAGKTEIDITDTSTIYTARTGFKSDIEMKLLGEALENRFHYKIVNNSVIPITILPDTLTVLDEVEDLQTAEFQYCFNIPEAQHNESNIIIIIRNNVWEDERIWIDTDIFNII